MSFDPDSTVAEATCLVQRGLFTDARTLLQTAPVRRHQGLFQHRQALLCDVLQQTGADEEAEAIACQALKTGSARSELTARFLFVLGNISRERGRIPEAVNRLQAADRLSHSDLELSCWIQLRLIASIADMAGTETAMARLEELRRPLIRFGEARPFAALHLWLAESEAIRGRLDAAQHHLQVAESLLSRIDDVWLRSYLAITSFGVSYYCGEIGEASRWAAIALQCANASGHRGSRRAAYANLACIELSIGNIARAEELLNSALTHCEEGSTYRIAALHTLAQIKLHHNDLEGCRSIVNTLDNLSATTDDSKSAYYHAWATQTKLEFLLKQRRTDDAKHLCIEAESILRRVSSPRVATGLRLLLVETLIADGDLLAAAERLRLILSKPTELPPDLFAETERVMAGVLLRCGAIDSALVNSQRASTTFHLIGHGIGTQRAFVQTTDMDKSSGRLIPLIPACVSVDRLRSLIDTRRQLELFGRESISLLGDMECVTSAALTCIDGSKTRQVLCSIGPSIAGDANPLILDLGTSDQRSLRLEFVPKKDPSALLATGSFQRVVTGISEIARNAQAIEVRETLWPTEERGADHGVVFAAPSMLDVVRTMNRIARTDVSVLITGETGTGKEVIAKAIHQRSNRAERPFVAINCSAVPKDLLESQLYGYRRGAFSGASDEFPGVIRAAEGGTLLIDEVGEIPLDMQTKLLRFLDCSEVHPLGESRPKRVNVRLLFATNTDLAESVKQGRFREDLFFRINVLPIRVPPLRERREEIPLLVNVFADRFSQEFSKNKPKFASETMEHLVMYRWPGNIRQLSNEVRRLVAMVDREVITPSHLSDDISRMSNDLKIATSGITIELDQNLTEAVGRLERAMVQYALTKSAGRVQSAADALGLSRKGLYLKRQRLGILNT
jgi:DNA-binding NtrC family response regulator/tetratricopeptide (TPR) repeat protein